MVEVTEGILPDAEDGGGSAAKEAVEIEGFDSETDFLREARTVFNRDVTADHDNRLAQSQDLDFEAGDQWMPEDWADREGRARLTINDLPQFIGQVIGDRDLNQTSIKIQPAEDEEDYEIAQIRSDIVRSIESRSNAERHYARAFKHQVGSGRGHLRVFLDWTGYDSFDQDIFIAAIPNPLGVVWDRMMTDVTGRDARHCFVLEDVTVEDFRARWPGIDPTSFSTADSQDILGNGWYDRTRGTVRVAEYWRMMDTPSKIVMLVDGQTRDITKESPEFLEEFVVPFVAKDASGNPMVRDVRRKFARRVLMSGSHILDQPYELKIDRLPIIAVTGRTVETETTVMRSGLTRPMKDPIRMRNFWRSVAADAASLIGRHKFFVSGVDGEALDEVREGIEGADEVVNIPTGGSVTESQGPQISPALLAQADFAQQDMRNVSGIHEASLGLPSNETSGKAILARQREGDVATSSYHTHMNHSIQELGEVVNQLIGYVYGSSPRTLPTLGEDGVTKAVRINDPDNPNSVDIRNGRYDVVVSTGPSFTTKRVEAVDSMLRIAEVFPQIMEVAGDMFAQNLDWPGADKLAERLRLLLPPEIQKAESQETEIPPEVQEMLNQAAELIKALQTELTETVAENEELKAEAFIKIREMLIKAYEAETKRIVGVAKPMSEDALAGVDTMLATALKEALESTDVSQPDDRDNLEEREAEGETVVGA